jgi:hypothetical protein
MGYSDLL